MPVANRYKLFNKRIEIPADAFDPDAVGLAAVKDAYMDAVLAARLPHRVLELELKVLVSEEVAFPV